MPRYKYSFDFGKIHTIEANIRQVLYTQGKQVYQFPLALKFAVNAEFLSKTFLCKGYRFFPYPLLDHIESCIFINF